MSVKRDVSKSFKMTSEMKERVNKWVENQCELLGLKQEEFIESHFLDVFAKELEESDTVSADIKRHFASDMSKLTDALSSIRFIFLSQMEAIAVEKNNWEQQMNVLQQQKTQEINGLKKYIIKVREEELENVQREKATLLEDIDAKQELINQFEEVKVLKDKEINTLTNRIEEVKELKDREIASLTKQLEESKDTYRDDTSKLNQQIVNLSEELTELKPTLKENVTLKENNIKLQSTNESLENKMKEQQKKHEYELQQLKETHQTQVDRMKTECSNRVEKEVLAKEKESLQETKELYATIEKIRAERDQMRADFDAEMKALIKKHELEIKKYSK
jgi:DNA repair exonuclease SbcCD ATPase subunit